MNRHNKSKIISIIYNDEILNSQKIDDNTNSDKIFFKSFKSKKDALSFIGYERIINSYRSNELIKKYSKKKENDNPLKEAAIKLMAEGIMMNDRKKVIESKKKFINLIHSDNIDTRIIISVLEIDMYLYNWEIFKKDFDEFFPLLAESDKNGYSYYVLGLASLVFDRDNYGIYFEKAIKLFGKDRTNYNSFINIITVYSILEQPEKAKFYYETNKYNFDDYTNFSTDHLFDITQEYMINVIVEQREKLK